jgi:DNA replication protein DnaC
LGNAAIDDGLTVAWFTIESLGRLVTRHRADDTVTRAVDRVLRADLVVVDDIGLLPVPAEAAEALFRVIDAAYERRSVAISSNIHPGGFDQLLPATIATAAVDRFMHHAHVVVNRGRLLPVRPSPRRQGGDAPDLTPWGDLMSAAGEFSCPPAGRSHIRPRGVLDDR